MQNIPFTLLCFFLCACGADRGNTNRGQSSPDTFVAPNLGSGPDFSAAPQLPTWPPSDSNDREDGVDTSSEGNISAPPSGLPQIGAWTTNSVTAGTNTCPDPQEDTFAPTAMNVSHNSQTSFELLIDTSAQGTLTCLTSGDSFSCGPLTWEFPGEDGQDITMVVTITATGTIQSSTSLVIDWTTAFSCQGADCDSAATSCSATAEIQVSPAE